MIPMLELTPLLHELLAQGRWPSNLEEERAQNLNSLVLPDRIRAFAPEESSVYLFAPPFHTIRELSKSNDFWHSKQAAPTEIDFDLTLDLGDFGLGSDAPIVLDYRKHRNDPSVMRLCWSDNSNDNHWITVAPDFPTFVKILGI